jgi:tetratricopeptide (TPR) repeat protein
MYVAKYPDQSFGYYWQARSNASLDKEMKDGLAIPVYKKLIEVLQGDTTNTNYKKWMVEALAYLAAYEANTQKNYDEAVDYFEKVLEVDPDNADAKRYIAILEKNTSTEGSK